MRLQRLCDNGVRVPIASQNPLPKYPSSPLPTSTLIWVPVAICPSSTAPPTRSCPFLQTRVERSPTRPHPRLPLPASLPRAAFPLYKAARPHFTPNPNHHPSRSPTDLQCRAGRDAGTTTARKWCSWTASPQNPSEMMSPFFRI
jgi:hypothetical protein